MKIIDENQNIDINLQDKNGWTPLHIATYLGYGGIIQFLVDKNADFTIQTFDFEMTPLSIAIDNLNLDLTIYFLSKGAEFTLASTNKSNSNMRNDYLKNLLDYANVNDDPAFCDVTKTIEQFFKEHQKSDNSNDLHLEDIDNFFVNYDKINYGIKADLLIENPIHSHED